MYKPLLVMDIVPLRFLFRAEILLPALKLGTVGHDLDAPRTACLVGVPGGDGRRRGGRRKKEIDAD